MQKGAIQRKTGSIPIWRFMKHLSEEALADFARNAATANARLAMDRHIQDGCRKCESALQVWQGVLSIARAENGITPPADIVRVVKSQFASGVAATKQGVRILFDSNFQPVAAGARGPVAARQLLYETDDYYIDLRLEPSRTSKSACLVGQVMNRTGGGRSPKELKVSLRKGLHPVIETTTNKFGEFQLEFEADHSLHLLLNEGEMAEVILPLYGVYNPNNRKDLE